MIYQAIREGQTYGRLIQQVTRRKRQWLYRYCMYSGGTPKFTSWMPVVSLPNPGSPKKSWLEWKKSGYSRLVR